MIDFLNYAGGIFLIILCISICFMGIELKSLIRKNDEFDRPKLNRDICYTILGIIICSFIGGGIFTINVLSIIGN